ncbi:MAG TPA: ATP synthase F1 subunit delta [Acidiferrobacter sp.]|nr:ATP synthase F1 subunit delta [Acidiferrobacter sp.]
MAEVRSLARPYAHALFALAEQQGRVDIYGEILANLDAIMANTVARYLAGAQKKQRLTLLAVIRDTLPDLPVEMSRLLDAMSDNKRLILLPIVHDLYGQYRRAHVGTTNIMVTCAYTPSEEIKAEIERRLQQRVKGQLRITYDCEPVLMGGFLVRIGDQVLDLSVREQMRRIGRELQR